RSLGCYAAFVNDGDDNGPTFVADQLPHPPPRQGGHFLCENSCRAHCPPRPFTAVLLLKGDGQVHPCKVATPYAAEGLSSLNVAVPRGLRLIELFWQELARRLSGQLGHNYDATGCPVQLE